MIARDRHLTRVADAVIEADFDNFSGIHNNLRSRHIHRSPQPFSARLRSKHREFPSPQAARLDPLLPAHCHITGCEFC